MKSIGGSVMMTAAFLWMGQTTVEGSSFTRDVVRRGRSQHAKRDTQAKIHSALLEEAIPLQEYEAKHNVKLSGESGLRRRAEEEAEEEEAAQEDDYYLNDVISFNGYSLKYAKCQPVQYFSEKAVQDGEHSPMVTDDIVILRLCPTNTCSSDSSYGCHYNYAEYAIDLSNYVRVMLRFSAQSRDYMCDYCNDCLAAGSDDDAAAAGDDGGRRLEEAAAGDDAAAQQDDAQEEAEEEADQDNYNNYNQAQYDNGGDDDAAAEEEEYNYYQNACGTWGTYCNDYSTLCTDNDDAYLAFEDYIEYLDCAEVEYNGYPYYVRPRCDGYQGTIKMAIYYDNYCVQYAGNEVSLKNLGLGFKETAFQDFYSSSCIDCSESEYPPYDSTSYLCNRINYDSASCTDQMSYELFDSSDDSDSECSFIESLRFGTYNEVGQLTSRGADGSMEQQVTAAQKVILFLSIATCVCLVIYACYLHHAMTNLLIKSLSHRELLPPSRHASRGRMNNSSPPRRASGRRGKGKGDPDWDDSTRGEYA